MDRLFTGLYRKMNPTVQDQVEQLRDKIEEMHLQILDFNEARDVLHNIREAREKQIEQLNQQLNECRKVRLEQSAAVARCTSLEADVRKLEKDLDICEKNRSHVFQLHQAKEAILKEAVKVTNEFRAKAAKSDEYKAQSEHLARQTIKLQEEVVQMRANHANMMSEFHKIKMEFPDLVAENHKNRELLMSVQKGNGIQKNIIFDLIETLRSIEDMSGWHAKRNVRAAATQAVEDAIKKMKDADLPEGILL